MVLTPILEDGNIVSESEEYPQERETLKSLFFDEEFLERLGIPMGFGGGAGGSATGGDSAEVEVEEV